MQRLGLKLQRPARLLPVPPALLRLGAALVGKSATISRLCKSLPLDVSATHSALGWSPPVSLEEGLTRTVTGLLSETRVDLVLALCASLLLAIPILIVALMVKLTSAGPVLYWSERVGRRNQNFYMPKFRSLREHARSRHPSAAEGRCRVTTPNFLGSSPSALKVVSAVIASRIIS